MSPAPSQVGSSLINRSREFWSRYSHLMRSTATARPDRMQIRCQRYANASSFCNACEPAWKRTARQPTFESRSIWSDFGFVRKPCCFNSRTVDRCGPSVVCIKANYAGGRGPLFRVSCCAEQPCRFALRANPARGRGGSRRPTTIHVRSCE